MQKNYPAFLTALDKAVSGIEADTKQTDGTIDDKINTITGVKTEDNKACQNTVAGCN